MATYNREEDVFARRIPTAAFCTTIDGSDSTLPLPFLLLLPWPLPSLRPLWSPTPSSVACSSAVSGDCTSAGVAFTANGRDGTGDSAHHAVVCNTMLSVPHALSSVNISVKYAGSALMRNICGDMVRTMSKHRSQNTSRLCSTRNGFSGYDISLPIYE